MPGLYIPWEPQHRPDQHSGPSPGNLERSPGPFSADPPWQTQRRTELSIAGFLIFAVDLIASLFVETKSGQEQTEE